MLNSLKPERLARTEIYRNPWVNLFVDKVRFPNGMVIEQYHKVEFDNSAAMAIPQNDSGEYLMVQVPRYTTGRAEWEFPAGHLEPGEEILAAARREVLEETGYTSSDYEMLYSYNPLVGITDQVFHILRCKVLQKDGDPDPNEIRAVQWFTEKDIWGMIRNGEMKDGYSLTSFLLHLAI